MLHQIGVGALGPVFRTYEPERDRLVAVKVFRLDITPEQAQALANELSAVAAAGLFHPSIVEPIQAGVEGTLAYGAEEYVAAESLDVAMRDYAPAPIATVLPLITQLAGAIDFARAAGVGHGALHPRDIFVAPEEIRATGFGVVEALERVGLRAPVRRPYSAPERIEGGGWSTPADIFSLAAIAFELLTGRRPAGLGDEIGPLTSGTPNGWTDALHAVLARAMDPEPARRHQTALALAAALEAAARGDFVAAGIAPAGAQMPSGDVADEQLLADLPAEDEWPARLAMATGAAAADTPVVEWEHSPAESDHDELSYEPDPAQADHGEPEADPPLFLRSQEPDDVVGERADDEADQQLVLQETSEPAPGTYGFGDFRSPEDADVESDSDRFIAEAAAAAPRASGDDLRAVGDRWGWRDAGGDDGFEEPPRHLTLGLESEETPADGADGTVLPHAAAGSSRDDEWFRSGDVHQTGAPPRERIYARAPDEADDEVEYAQARGDRRTVWMAAALLVVGLLGGVAMGYAVWGRAAGDAGTAADVLLPGDVDAAGPPREVGAVADAPARVAGDGPPATPPPADAPPAMGEREAVATPAPAAPRPTRGTLVVRSTPSGAGVTVNGTWRGRTPLTLDNLPLTRYQVRVVEPGFTVATRTVTLSAGSPEATVDARLEQQAAPAARGTQPAGRGAPAAARGTQAPQTLPAQAFTGSIYVDSRPRGAAVSINGKPVGVTPLRIPEMPIGTHVVRLELPDHRIWSSTARVTAGQEARVTGSLDPIR